MDNAVCKFIRQYQLIRSHSTVLLAVSGGPDSLALLHFFYKMRSVWDLRLIVVSVDHQLRGQQSQDDLDFVRQTCKVWRIEFVGTSLDVDAYQKENQIGTQQAARERRYQFFAEQMKLYQADYLAFGHHADDQLETMLMGLIHSANAKSLAGIPIKRGFATGTIIRPFLSVTKAQIEHYCHKHDLKPKRDPSNADDTYTRNHYRHNILPLLKENNHNWHQTIQHLSASLQEDEAFLYDEAKNMVADIVNFDETAASVSFNIHMFKAYASPLQRRALHLILGYLYKENQNSISYRHEKQFFRLLTNDHGHSRIDFPHSLRLVRSYSVLTFFFHRCQSLSYRKDLAVPGEVYLPGGGHFQAAITNEADKAGRMVYVCSAQAVALPLHIRTRRPGDRMRWRGLKGHKKVKDIFIDAKIPADERDTWPVVTDNHDNVLWLPGLKKGLPPLEADNGSYIQVHYTNGAT